MILHPKLFSFLTMAAALSAFLVSEACTSYFLSQTPLLYSLLMASG
jgi:hypothetical protein